MINFSVSFEQILVEIIVGKTVNNFREVIKASLNYH